MSRNRLTYLLVYPLNCLTALILGYLFQSFGGSSDASIGLIPFETLVNAVALAFTAALFMVMHLTGLGKNFENQWSRLLVFLICLEGASLICFKQSIFFLMLPNMISGISKGSLDEWSVPLAILLAIPISHWATTRLMRK